MQMAKSDGKEKTCGRRGGGHLLKTLLAVSIHLAYCRRVHMLPGSTSSSTTWTQKKRNREKKKKKKKQKKGEGNRKWETEYVRHVDDEASWPCVYVQSALHPWIDSICAICIASTVADALLQQLGITLIALSTSPTQ